MTHEMQVVDLMILSFHVIQRIAVLLPRADHVRERPFAMAESIEWDDVFTVIALPDLGPYFAFTFEPLLDCQN